MNAAIIQNKEVWYIGISRLYCNFSKNIKIITSNKARHSTANGKNA
jgi:hypothetical protein